MGLPYDPVIGFLGIYCKEMKTCVHTKKAVQKDLKYFVHRGTKLETTQISFNEWLNHTSLNTTQQQKETKYSHMQQSG